MSILKFLGLYKSTQTTTNTTQTTNTITSLPSSKIKVALCLGLNDYPGTGNDLAGCVNDAMDFSEYFKTKEKFAQVEVLLNSDYTYANFVAKINQLITLNPDVFVITNSSHGTSMPDDNGDEIDGKDEAICMYDKNVRDDDIRKILDKIPLTTTTIIFSDSCFSGTVTRSFLTTMNSFEYISAPRYLPPSDPLDAVSLLMLPLKSSVFTPKNNRREILFSGCSSAEYSYDASFNNRANGAFTYYCLKILKENNKLTYEDFYSKIRNFLPSSRYPQTPQFEYSTDLLKKEIMFE